MSYSIKVVREQGGSVLAVKSGGLLSLENGGSVTLNLSASDSNTVKLTNGTISAFLFFGGDLPTFSASPGAVYFRSDGSAAGMYVNVSTGAAGSVWAAASLNRP